MLSDASGNWRYLEPSHRATLGVQHRELQPRQRVMLAAFGNVAHLMRHQPTYGVEIGFRQRHAESLVDALYRRVAADPVSMVGQAEDVALVFRNVEFVLDLA